MLRKGLAYGLMFVLVAGSAAAQMFSHQEGQVLPREQPVQRPAGASQHKAEPKQQPKNDALEQINSAFVTAQPDTAKDEDADDPLNQVAKALEKNGKKVEGETAKAIAEAMSQEDDEDVFIPEGELYRLNTPTLDGSVRGGQAFVEVDSEGRMKKVNNIFLFYDKFKVSNYVSNIATCDVRFNILSNLDQKINRLDVKLVWPDLTTTLSFTDVQPNTQTYYNYSLLGNGCYNMDKTPNIIVNRCRVKGMTAAQCADKLIWLSK